MFRIVKKYIKEDFFEIVEKTVEELNLFNEIYQTIPINAKYLPLDHATKVPSRFSAVITPNTILFQLKSFKNIQLSGAQTMQKGNYLTSKSMPKKLKLKKTFC